MKFRAGAIAHASALTFLASAAGAYYSPFQKPTVAFEDVERLARDSEVRSLEDLLSRLPSEFRERYALMHRSRSLQEASYQKPRAIMFEDDASLLAAFNDPSMPGGNTLELIQFRESERRWEFREITFPESGRPIVSGPNPRKCLECHQSPSRVDADPRPNWEPYNKWPGAYGAISGMLNREVGYTDRENLLSQDKRFVAEQPSQKPELEKFLAGAKVESPRYRTLGKFQEHLVVELTNAVIEKNDFRVARLMSEAPDWDVYKLFLVKSFLCRDEYATGKWDRIGGRDLFLGADFPDELTPLHMPLAQPLAMNVRRMDLQIRGPAHLVDVFFEARGVDVSDWSTDFRSGGRFAFQDRFGTGSNPYAQFRSALEIVSGAPASFCQRSQALAAEAVRKWRATGRLREAARTGAARARELSEFRYGEPKRLLAKCASCHGAEGSDPDAPAIPFDDLTALRTKLAKTGYKRGRLLDEIALRVRDLASAGEQMPPTGNWSPESRTGLLAYLKSLLE